MKYRYSKKAGALQEAAPVAAPVADFEQRVLVESEAPEDSYVAAHDTGEFRIQRLAATPSTHAQAVQPWLSAPSLPARVESSTAAIPFEPERTVFFYVIPEGQHVLVIQSDGSMRELVGPERVWRRGRRFETMPLHVAHPGEFLIVRFRDGRQEHIAGPTHVWFDRRKHLEIRREDAIQIAEKEAIVVYFNQDDDTVSRRIVYGPASFVPNPGEWLHTFSWHGSRGGTDGYRKVPNALVFQKLWLLPDQMYHDVEEVRTADGVVVTIRLMLFFELVDVETMLATTHDPIGDFVNAATSDVVEYLGKHDFESFKAHTERLNELDTYKNLVSRAEQCGYRINKVVYRGYGAPPALQNMHDQALESRTRLQLEKATQRQQQELEDFKLERELDRAAKQRAERKEAQAQEIELAKHRQEAELAAEEARSIFEREQRRLDAEQAHALARLHDEQRIKHLSELRQLKVDLTSFLTQGRADHVVEVRGAEAGGTHVHLGASGGEKRG